MRGKTPIPYPKRCADILAKAVYNPINGCLERGTCRTKFGYTLVKLDPLGRHKTGAHRFVWMVMRGPIPAGMKVLHKCDNRCCINIEHLMLGTLEDNMRQMCERARGINGYGPHKMNEQKVREARNLRATKNMSVTDLARLYGVTQQVMGQTLLGRYWSWVK